MGGSGWAGVREGRFSDGTAQYCEHEARRGGGELGAQDESRRASIEAGSGRLARQSIQSPANTSRLLLAQFRSLY